MGEHFRRPRAGCVGRILARHVPDGPLPTPPEASRGLCVRHLPKDHEMPAFFRVRAEAQTVGREDLRRAYDNVHGDYDEFWLAEAAAPTDELIARLDLSGDECVFEAGCGTGYGTLAAAARLAAGGTILAVDISEGMLEDARRRAAARGQGRIAFAAGDALEMLAVGGAYDIVLSSWVLGYIPLDRFFAAARGALAPSGRLAFVVHKEDSPREALEIFARLVADDPAALTKRVAFDFPRDRADVERRLKAAGFVALDLREGSITFRYSTPRAALDHLLKSGAGTAFYEAIRPEKRATLEMRFLDILARRHEGAASFDVVHDYVSCIARKV